MRILIAEDSRTSRLILSKVLKKGGHEVVETVDGVEAWDVLQRPDAPRLVILDWLMPGMNGLEVVQRVRALRPPRPPYIIILTAWNDTADIFTGLEAGADDYLAKPVDAGELLSRVNHARRIVEMQGALEEYGRTHGMHPAILGQRYQESLGHRDGVWSNEEKVAIVLEMLRGDGSVVAICSTHGVMENDAYQWFDWFMEGGRRAIADASARDVSPGISLRDGVTPGH